MVSNFSRRSAAAIPAKNQAFSSPGSLRKVYRPKIQVAASSSPSRDDPQAPARSKSSVFKGVIDLSGGGSSGSRAVAKKECVASPSKSIATDQQLQSLGKNLVRILRHQAVEMGLKIRSDGYCRMNDLLKLQPMRGHSIQDVLKVVETDLKTRFSTTVENGILFIRANQGHSMKAVVTEKLLEEIESADQVPVCVHGTFKKNLASIRRTGLCVMGRNHVHFATGLPRDDGVVSGMRKTCDALIFLDVEKALDDGMELFISENRVVLTEGFGGVVPPRYFSRIIEWPSKRVL
ncbi:tRNA 2'-phosphotransferase 1 [Selaginella moellendorffii]|nr:tRNA 2'-phosphotransferase 1 [Selaginella moellendorffii]|eukprot:XP_002993383.2 tRNA 2'-phosphotransferase 1 [Selaginella moellendorffii]